MMRRFRDLLRLTLWKSRAKDETVQTLPPPPPVATDNPEDLFRLLAQECAWPTACSSQCRRCQQPYLIWTPDGLECASCERFEISLPESVAASVCARESEIATRLRIIGVEALRSHLKMNHPNMFTFLWLRRWVPEIHEEIFGCA